MKIAVLLSTYNGHKYLNQQLESLAHQTVVDSLTVYIRDDGSTDDTFEIIARWKKTMKIVLRKEKNVGPAMGFWRLLNSPLIQADYYAFCDQDDVWDQDKLQIAVEQLKGDTHFYACNCRIIDENGAIVNPCRLKTEPQTSIQRLFVSGYTQGCSMVFTDTLRKYIVGKHIQCIPMHDIIVMLYATQFGRIYWDQVPRFGYRVHSNNVVAKSNKSKIQQIKTTIWNWKNSSKNSMAKVAQEMLNNVSDLSNEDMRFLQMVADYRRHKIKLCQMCRAIDAGKNAKRSFRLRVLLGLY